MQSALYYPFTGPERESFLKTALFLWDTVDFIVPYHGFNPHGKSKEEDEALEIIGRAYVPTENDKRNAHDELDKLCRGPISKRFKFKLKKPEALFDFYPQKLLHKTWEMLSRSRLATIINGDGGISRASTGPLFGYYMMTILAVCCAQGHKRLVTDQSDPYRALTNILADDAPKSPSMADWHGRLIALTFKGPDFENVSLRRLIDLRTRESQLLASLRQAFLREVDSAASDIAKNANNQNIVRERIEQFTGSMERDFKELKRALNRSATSSLLSKEFCFSVLAATSAVALEPFSGSVLTVGGLTKGLMKYQDRRREILREHPSAWPLVVGGPKFPIT